VTHVFVLSYCLLLFILATAAQAADPKALPDAELAVVAELDQGPGNIAVTPDGRIIVSQHQFYAPEYRVVEVLPDGSTKPFPNAAWSSAPDDSGIGFNAVLGIRSDRRGVVWMLDNGGDTPKIVAWDSHSDTLHRVIYLPPPVTRPGSMHNDLAIDLVHQAIYIADLGGEPGPALVVVDLTTGLSRRLLENHPSVQAEDVPMVIDGKPVTVTNAAGETVAARVGVNPITLDPTNTWVYYGAMHGTTLWRIRTRALLDPALSAEELGARVERYGTKPVSDGISIDAAGNVYSTDVTTNAIGVTGPDGEYRIYAQDPKLSWPDAISAGPDGFFYAAVNQLHRSAPLNGGKDASKPPYYIVRFRALDSAVVGR